MGRELQKVYGQAQQVIMTMPLLEGLDGVQKMSKSYDNYIGVEDAPRDMFGKVMSVSDGLMLRYYELLSSISPDDFVQLQGDLKSGALHPKDAKVSLSKELVERFYDKKTAEIESDAFFSQFKDKEIPEDIFKIGLDKSLGKSISNVLSEAGLVASKGEAKRLVVQNAVKIILSGQSLAQASTVKDPNETFTFKKGDVIKVGKRKWLGFE